MVERTWKSGCGKFRVKLTGEPLFVVNCHCHSCVACMRHIDAKGGGRNTSAAAEHSNGGVAKAFFYLKHVEFCDDNPAEKIQFLKLGDTGKNLRSYTRCCGTQLNTAAGGRFPQVFGPSTGTASRTLTGQSTAPIPPAL